MKYLIFVSLLVIASCVHLDYTETYHKILDYYSEGSPKELFKVWHFLNKKEYDLNSEYSLTRYKKFKDNLKLIKAHSNKNLPYKLGLNEFSDLS